MTDMERCPLPFREGAGGLCLNNRFRARSRPTFWAGSRLFGQPSRRPRQAGFAAWPLLLLASILCVAGWCFHGSCGLVEFFRSHVKIPIGIVRIGGEIEPAEVGIVWLGKPKNIPIANEAVCDFGAGAPKYLFQ